MATLAELLLRRCILITDSTPARSFRASRAWTSNVYGAIVAGMGATCLICAVAGILLWETEGNTKAISTVMVLSTIGTLIAEYPGNLIAASPYAVELKPGVSLLLRAPFKTVYIPLSDVRSVKYSPFRLGYTVSLRRRKRLLTGFVIHKGFGAEGPELARAIQEEIIRRDSVGLPL